MIQFSFNGYTSVFSNSNSVALSQTVLNKWLVCCIVCLCTFHFFSGIYCSCYLLHWPGWPGYIIYNDDVPACRWLSEF